MSSDEIPTPNTDEASFGTGQVSVDFARRMEREKTLLIRQLEMLRDDWLTYTYGSIVMHRCARDLNRLIQEASNE